MNMLQESMTVLRRLYDSARRRKCSSANFNLSSGCRKSGKLFCEANWNVASCWPPVEAGMLAVIPCPEEWNGIRYTYVTEANVSRQCFENGTWDRWSNYSECLSQGRTDYTAVPGASPDIINLISTVLHYFGYSLSLATCILAICIYAKFRTLCRLRNVIHLNLITTYVFSASVWMTMTLFFYFKSQQNFQSNEEKMEFSEEREFPIIKRNILHGMIIAFTYCQMTTFFWTFCEGLYMTCILFKPHKLEQLTFWPFGAIGWLLPAIITLIWTLVKVNYEENVNWLSTELMSPYNFIFIAPVLTVLMVNLILLFLSLHTILKKQSGRISQPSSLVGRGVRSFLILMPLLGLTYVIVLVQPNDPAVVKAVFQIITAILLPIQGFFVAVLYCFCNRQVRGLLKVHCYRKVMRFGCFRSVPESTVKVREYSSGNQPNFDARSFRGNHNEYQYYLRTRKSQERFANTESFRFDGRSESLKLNRLSSRSSKAKFPVVVV
ncbi:corticotropin-releasing factor receptor 2-like isoform X1 [Paramacrobiotus metropolitanus]|uniref:corticotropin-releasing factor receptor 2-like isoform X1 n=1 Tax=Paramacrobiotus metropolitanus TaxID=2943436 RepID=UPI002446161E|nr:corticotropin-releasing factor receptor 2-like isoform X1 [Paramacrobiotus metropolitanus]